MKKARRKLIRSSFVITAILLLLTGVVANICSTRLNAQTEEAAKWERHTYEVLSQLDAATLLLSMKERSNGQLLSGRTASLFRGQVSRLKVLTADNPAQLPNVNLLAREVGTVAENAAEVVVLKNVSSTLSTLALMRTIELDLLKERVIAIDDSRARLSQAVNYGGAIATMLLIVMAVFGLFEVLDRRSVERQLTQSISSLQTANRELLEYSDVKTSQLENTVHDLKNPLGSISGYAELIKEDAHSESDVIELSERVKRLSTEMLQLVEGLLLDRSAPALFSDSSCAVVDLYQFISSCIETAQVLASRKFQVIGFDFDGVPIIARLNEKAFKAALMNVLDNAVKYSPQTSMLQVTVTHHGARLEIAVSDCGPGFTKFDRERMFERRQVLSAKPTGGEVATGLGLNIAKLAMESFGGTLRLAESALGAGSTFIFNVARA